MEGGPPVLTVYRELMQHPVSSWPIAQIRGTILEAAYAVCTVFSALEHITSGLNSVQIRSVHVCDQL